MYTNNLVNMKWNEKGIIGVIKTLLINSIESLKDEEYQKRVWFRAEGPEVDSYEDSIIHFLTYSHHILNDPSAINFIGEDRYNLIKKLNKLIRMHLNSSQSKMEDVDCLEEEELLNDPKWQDIIALTSELDIKLKQLLKEKESE